MPLETSNEENSADVDTSIVRRDLNIIEKLLTVMTSSESEAGRALNFF